VCVGDGDEVRDEAAEEVATVVSEDAGSGGAGLSLRGMMDGRREGVEADAGADAYGGDALVAVGEVFALEMR
jgi:hypothetical protein